MIKYTAILFSLNVREKTMSKNFITAFLLFLFLGYSYSQTSEKGNYELYTREILNSSFGYFNSKIRLPDMFGAKELVQYGASYTHFYDVFNIGFIPVDHNNQVSFYLNGEFKIAFAAGKESNISGFPITNEVVKFYTGSMDIFSLYLTPEFTHVLSNGNAFVFQFGINLLNIGGTLSFPEKGIIKKHLVGTINLIPLGFAPSIFFDFGRSGLGFRVYLNLNDILSYNIASSNVFGENYDGIKTFESIIQRSDFQIVFVF